MRRTKINNRKHAHHGGSQRPTSRKRISISLDFINDLLPDANPVNGGPTEDASQNESDFSGSEMDDLATGDTFTHAGDCFQIQEIPGKGFGLIATIPIAKYAIILNEPPLFILLASTPMPASSSALDALIAAQGLSGEAKTAISKLSNSHLSESTHPAIGILKTNSLPVTMRDLSGKERKAGGLFKVVCRVNHSCVPNSTARWGINLGERGEMRIVASRDIKLGEEITISYGVVIEDLKRKFGFECDCEKCKLNMPTAHGIILSE